MLLLSAIRRAAPGARSILVVDDEPDIREAIQDLLESSIDGASIMVAESGMAALDLLRVHGVDLIVTDYKMPGMNGVAFLREADKLSPGIPRVILTAFDRELFRELGAAAKKERILQKPVEPEQLLALVEASLAGTSA